ncbi:hypothetical protein C8Q77DRAFT_273172 [Trametes polyzona]|nr:hypothetical protein C8Q77DRAFT_273172 [Trametes polyzona]
MRKQPVRTSAAHTDTLLGAAHLTHDLAHMYSTDLRPGPCRYVYVSLALSRSLPVRSEHIGLSVSLCGALSYSRYSLAINRCFLLSAVPSDVQYILLLLVLVHGHGTGGPVSARRRPRSDIDGVRWGVGQGTPRDREDRGRASSAPPSFPICPPACQCPLPAKKSGSAGVQPNKCTGEAVGSLALPAPAPQPLRRGPSPKARQGGGDIFWPLPPPLCRRAEQSSSRADAWRERADRTSSCRRKVN